MVKNQMQTKCGQEMTQVLEQISLENREAVENSFPLDVLSRANLSKGAQRTFDNILEIFRLMKMGPQVEYRLELESQLHTMQLESLYYKTKKAQIDQKIELASKPKFDAKLCLRDTL